MNTSWDAKIDAFWSSADESQPEQTLAAMRELLQELPADAPEALYEWASVHDFLGKEQEAVPLYEAALAAGLSGDRKPQAVIQLASSLRNIGNPEAAVKLLEGASTNTVTGDAADAFLALALRDCGRTDEALQVSLLALSRSLPVYRRPVERYARALHEADMP